MTPIVDFIQQLEAVARLNEDEFSYNILLVPSRGHRKFFMEIAFIVKEEADGHEILSGTGATIDEAVASAQDGWQESLRNFGYEIK